MLYPTRLTTEEIQSGQSNKWQFLVLNIVISCFCVCGSATLMRSVVSRVIWNVGPFNLNGQKLILCKFIIIWQTYCNIKWSSSLLFYLSISFIFNDFFLLIKPPLFSTFDPTLSKAPFRLRCLLWHRGPSSEWCFLAVLMSPCAVLLTSLCSPLLPDLSPAPRFLTDDWFLCADYSFLWLITPALHLRFTFLFPSATEFQPCKQSNVHSSCFSLWFGPYLLKSLIRPCWG